MTKTNLQAVVEVLARQLDDIHHRIDRLDDPFLFQQTEYEAIAHSLWKTCLLSGLEERVNKHLKRIGSPWKANGSKSDE